MANWQLRAKRTREVKARAERPSHIFTRCRVIGCGKPARAGTSDGLDEKYCQSHVEHLRRHGSIVKGSYRASEINPYRRAALNWLTANEHDIWVSNAIQRVVGLYRGAGPYTEAFRLRGLSPAERANAAWARLRHYGVDPRLPLAGWLAVEMILRDDPKPVLTPEYKQVQAAKIVHRMVSGSHKRWERPAPLVPAEAPPKPPATQELHVYPRPRGRLLRHIGASLEQAAELLVDKRLEVIEESTKAQLEAGRAGGRPWSRNWRARSRDRPEELCD